MADAPTAVPESASSTISNLVVQITREHTGRGPTRARTFINEDLVTVVLQDALTKGEQHLVGEHDALVLSGRRAHQDGMRTALIAGVEAVLDRRVLAFLSCNSIDPDYSVENVVLVPQAR